MPSESLNTLLERCIAAVGERQLRAELKRVAATPDRSGHILTIVANAGIHQLPDWARRGDVYLASQGNMDFSSPEKAAEEYRQILRALGEKLKLGNWDRIYLVPFGPITLAMQIKLLVFRMTHIETTDLFFLGAGRYFDFDLDQRELIAGLLKPAPTKSAKGKRRLKPLD